MDAGSGVVEDAWPELTDEEWLTRFADAEFDSQLSSLTAGHGFGQREVDEARACLDALLETRAFIASLQAKELRLLARLEELALAEPGKHAPSREREMALRSMAAEVALATTQSSRSVQASMNRASGLVSRLPETVSALAAGVIGLGHARAILEHSGNLEGEALTEYEELVLEKAKTTTPHKLSDAAKTVAARLRPGTLEERHEEARAERCVELFTLDEGMSQLVHTLPTVHATAIFDRLTRGAKAIHAADSSDPRTRDQLRSDLATDLLLTGEPYDGEDAPHTAARGIKAEVAITIPALTLLGVSSDPATLLGQGPIDLNTACHLAAGAPELLRVITDPVTGIAITADTYRPTASLRRFLHHRDGHCRFPTCHQPAARCDIDHTHDHQHGGKTTPDNLAVLCRGHHTLKHQPRWTVKQPSPGILEWTAPHGTTATSTPHTHAPPRGPTREPTPAGLTRTGPVFTET